ncbi:MAG TPA: hypothetical protein VGJ30_15105 [Candidatus Angelobacter sp.]|jgi:hypothetical protein
MLDERAGHPPGGMRHPINMGWIQDYRRQSSQDSHDHQDAESQFAAAARSRWQELGDELRADVAEFNKQGTGADLAVEGEDSYRVRNSDSGLELVLKADFNNHSASYDYTAMNQRSAGVPEGGMLSMRQSRRGDVEFYSADERLTSEETRQVLLEPLLFPKQPAA